MADQATLDAIETGELIIQVDTGRPVGDPFKLVASLETTVATRLADTKAKHAAVVMTESATVGASEQRKQALANLEKQEQAVNESLKPQTVAEADELHQKLQGALEELKAHRETLARKEKK